MARSDETGERFGPVGPPERGEPPQPLWRRLLWFAGLAVASVTVVSAVAYALRGLLFIG